MRPSVIRGKLLQRQRALNAYRRWLHVKSYEVISCEFSCSVSKAVELVSRGARLDMVGVYWDANS